MRAAFAAYAESHEPASIRRCWSTWNTLCTFLFANEEIPMNPMPLIGRPKLAKTLPKAAIARHPRDVGILGADAPAHADGQASGPW